MEKYSTKRLEALDEKLQGFWQHQNTLFAFDKLDSRLVRMSRHQSLQEEIVRELAIRQEVAAKI